MGKEIKHCSGTVYITFTLWNKCTCIWVVIIFEISSDKLQVGYFIQNVFNAMFFVFLIFLDTLQGKFLKKYGKIYIKSFSKRAVYYYLLPTNNRKFLILLYFICIIILSLSSNIILENLISFPSWTQEKCQW